MAAAEQILHIDPAACVLNCRRAMECAVKWMYLVDKDLAQPYDQRLAVLMAVRISGILWAMTCGSG